MAIHSTPLLGPPAQQHMNGGIEVYVAECHHVSAAPQFASHSELGHFRGLTVLVNLSPDSADRAALQPLLYALTFARCSAAVSPAAEWPRRLIERLSSTRPDFVGAAVYVGCKRDVVAETVQLALDALHRSFAKALAVAIVVSPSDIRLSSLAGASGFVCGLNETTGQIARTTFLMLSTLMAANTLNGIDVLDLLPVLGTAAAPAVLTESIWIHHGLRRLVHASEVEADELRTADIVLSVPFIAGLTWSGLRELSSELSSDTSRSADVKIFATDGALAPGVISSGWGWVPMLSRRLPR